MRLSNDAKRAARSEHGAFLNVVERLTNWQRNQWARRGYPGLPKKDASKVEPFTHLRRA